MSVVLKSKYREGMLFSNPRAGSWIERDKKGGGVVFVVVVALKLSFLFL